MVKRDVALEELVKIAHTQGNKINLSEISIAINSNESDDIQRVILNLIDLGIETIIEDVEPEDDGCDTVSQPSADGIENPFDPLKIDIKMDKMTVDSVIKRLRYTELELNSSFQRKSGLWNKKQKSQLIESMLLRIPLPAFYFDASEDDKWLIIDGLQRVTTIKDFIVDQSFKLEGMEFLKELDGKNYSTLSRALQRRIEETNINAYLVNPSTPKNVKFNIFKRINTGGLILEPQEIRNALYQGQATTFINELARNSCFINATDDSIKSDRMLDREFCVRYIAFVERPLESYSGSMENFLNNAMEYLENCGKSDLQKITERFEFTMDSCNAIFGINTFRKIFADGRRRPVNKAIFESWSFVISRLDKNIISKLIYDKEKIVDKFIELCQDYNYLNELKSQDKVSVIERIKKVQNLVEIILKRRIRP